MKINLFKPFLAPEGELMPALKETLYSGYISEGPRVHEFEQEFAKFIHAPQALAFSSGTAALHVALILAGVGRGDEVISTPMTAEPTNLAILHTGAKIVWADVEPRSGNISPESIREKMTEQTKAIMVVHYGGVPVDMHAIKPEVVVIADCAHALGARYDGHDIASYGNYAMFSLQAIKHVSTCDGGMLTVYGDWSAAHARRLRFFGIDRQAPRTEMDVTHVGYKYNMHDVTATMGLVQLKHAQEVIGRYIANGKYFDEALRGIPGLELCRWSPLAEPSYWFYTVFAEDCDGLSRKLTEAGIGNGKIHRRNDWHSVFAESACELPGLDEFWAGVLHVPCHWAVGDEEREYIMETMRSGW